MKSTSIASGFLLILIVQFGCGPDESGADKKNSGKKAAKEVESSQRKQTRKSEDPETLVRGGYDKKEMDDAIERAKREVDSFLKEFESGNGEDFAVKAPIEENGKTEHFWLTDISFADGKFHGLIGNDPGTVKSVQFGQKWTIAKKDISDWMFVRKGKIYGNYTMRPLLKTMPKAQADEFRKQLAELEEN